MSREDSRRAPDIRRETDAVLPEYASIPVAFEVREVLDLAPLSRRASALSTRAIPPYRKDYDELPDNSPLSWATQHDTSRWIFLIARVRNDVVAGAIAVTDPNDVVELGGREGNALLWDVRVGPEFRRHGFGRALISAAEEVARDAGAQALDVETQDTNVPACTLYLACGYTLTAVQPHAYEPVTDEAKLLWTKAPL
jgi:ribosomal protein S18 acetylase RimI-like enzyme